MKYLADPKVQATWHTGTGYFPISKGALDDPQDVDYRKDTRGSTSPSFNDSTR